MRSSLIVLVLALASTSNLCGLTKARVSATVASGTAGPSAVSFAANGSAEQLSQASPAKIDFDAQVKPILVSRCHGCHFPGGVMYERLPFDRPATIKTLGEKLFTRLKDEHDRRVIREFLSQ